MKPITLRNLSKDVLELIGDTAAAERLDRPAAVAKLLDNLATDRAIEHDIALFRSWSAEEEEVEQVSPGRAPRCCCCHARCAC